VKPGIYEISNEEYHSSPGVSRSALELVRRSPAIYRAKVLGNRRDLPTKALREGTAVHTAVLEPHLFNSQYKMLPGEINTRTKAGKEEIAGLKEKYPNVEWLDEDTFNMVMGVSTAVLNHPLASKLLTEGKAEQSIYWNDPDTKVLCKVRPDFLRNNGICVDLKTTSSAHPQEFIQSVIKFKQPSI
jgi:hypothetical protein